MNHLTDGKILTFKNDSKDLAGFWQVVMDILETEVKPIVSKMREGATLIKFVKGILYLNNQPLMTEFSLGGYEAKNNFQPSKPRLQRDEFSARREHSQSWKNTKIFQCNTFGQRKYQGSSYITPTKCHFQQMT